MLFSYGGFVNLDNNSDNYAKFTQGTYALNINRRAYSIGAFYKESSEVFGIQFNINNFDFSGLSEKFWRLILFLHAAMIFIWGHSSAGRAPAWHATLKSL